MHMARFGRSASDLPSRPAPTLLQYGRKMTFKPSEHTKLEIVYSLPQLTSQTGQYDIL